MLQNGSGNIHSIPQLLQYILLQHIQCPFVLFLTVINQLLFSLLGDGGRIRAQQHETDIIVDRLHPGGFSLAQILGMVTVFLYDGRAVILQACSTVPTYASLACTMIIVSIWASSTCFSARKSTYISSVMPVFDASSSFVRSTSGQ